MFLKSISTALIAGALFVSALSSMASAADHKVTIKGFAFSPATLSVEAGDTVTFTNADGAPHTATANDNSFGTKTLNSGDSEQVTIKNAGTFAYFCQIHPSMKAKIVAKKVAAATDKAAGQNSGAEKSADTPRGSSGYSTY